MGDPISIGLGLGLKAASSVAEGISGMQAANGEKFRADINSYVGETRYVQTNTAHRQGLESELGEIRAGFAANGQRPMSANLELLNEVRRVRNRERRINVGNEKRGAMDSRIAGKNAMARGRASLLNGLGNAAPSLFDLAERMRQ